MPLPDMMVSKRTNVSIVLWVNYNRYPSTFLSFDFSVEHFYSGFNPFNFKEFLKNSLSLTFPLKC